MTKTLRKILTLILVGTILLLTGCNRQTQHNNTFEGTSYPFFGLDTNGEESDIVAVNNALFDCFSNTQGTNPTVSQFGNEATYFEWVAEKILFTADTAYKEELKLKIQNYPQTETGYLWSWTTSPWWPTGEGDMHYDGIFRYVSAVYDVVRYENSLSFLDAVCAIGTESGINGTYGKTVYEKCDLALSYAINYLHGNEGVIHLTSESMLLTDGKRIDEKDGKYLWNNTGKAGSSASNYWDNLCFGGYDAYETMLFYHALQDMLSIEKLRNNEQKVAEYSKLLPTVRQKFDEYFWNEEKGRYIDCIDEEGTKIDFGLTFLNTEALAYGLGDEKKANLIFSWIDGTRIVKGDTVTGKDIMNYTKLLNGQKKWYEKKIEEELYFAPVSNTKAIESYRDKEGNYWWNDLEGNITVDPKKGNATYGDHLENGGYIFYTVYYELLARAKYKDAEDIANRYSQMAKVYVYNLFDSDEGDWMEGLCGEFPESGLVYMGYIYAVLGILIQENSLCITPNLPEKCSYLGVKDFSYSSQKLTILVSQKEYTVYSQEGNLAIPLVLPSQTETSYTVRTYDDADVLLSETKHTAGVLVSYEKSTRKVTVSW